MPKVKVMVRGNIEIAIRKFKQKCANAGILEDVKKKESYEKPTEKRKRKKKQAKNRTKVQQARNNINKKRMY